LRVEYINLLDHIKKIPKPDSISNTLIHLENSNQGGASIQSITNKDKPNLYEKYGVNRDSHFNDVSKNQMKNTLNNLNKPSNTISYNNTNLMSMDINKITEDLNYYKQMNQDLENKLNSIKQDNNQVYNFNNNQEKNSEFTNNTSELNYRKDELRNNDSNMIKSNNNNTYNNILENMQQNKYDIPGENYQYNFNYSDMVSKNKQDGKTSINRGLESKTVDYTNNYGGGLSNYPNNYNIDNYKRTREYNMNNTMDNLALNNPLTHIGEKNIYENSSEYSVDNNNINNRYNAINKDYYFSKNELYN